MNPTPDDSWPVCPQCDTPQLTSCPGCETVGHTFELGDDGTLDEEPLRDPRGESDAPSASTVGLRLCWLCDEPFHPKFYRYCPACGFDFGKGKQPDIEPELDVNDRMTIVAAGLVILFVVVLGWFWWVLQ